MNLKAERLNRGLRVPEAAEKIGVAPHVLRTAEQGTLPRPAAAKLIADFYGVKVSDIWPIGEPDRAQAAA